MTKIQNLFKTKSIPKSKLGNQGYDNPRENIDPHIRTKAVSAKELTLSDGSVAGFVKNDGSGVLSGGNAGGAGGLGAVAEDILPATDDTYDVGSKTKQWAYLWTVIAVLASLVIGTAINLSQIDGKLFINESTTINGSLDIRDNINATSGFIGDNEIATLNDLTGGNITVTEVIRIQNKQGTSMPPLSLIHFSGYNIGQNVPEAQYATSTSSTKQAECITSETIANNQFGSCVVSGLIFNVDTSTFTEDVLLHMNTTNGTMTEIQPVAVQCVQEVGEVLRSHASQGVMFANVPPGCEEVPSFINVTGNITIGGSTIWSNGTHSFWD